MAIKMIKGNIMDNWCAGNNDMILLVGHSHLLKDRYYLNNPVVAAVKNLVPDFHDFMSGQIKSAIERNGPDYPYTIISYEEKSGDEVIQRLGFMFTRKEWDKPPVPDFIKVAFDAIFIRIALHMLYEQPMKPIIIQDPLTSDIEMSSRAVEAMKRIYPLYPPEMQVWFDDKKSSG